MKRFVTLLVLSTAAGLAPAASEQATYEPQRRLRTPLDTCLATEVMQEAYCVRKCQPGFRMEMSAKRAQCVATRPDAKYTPPAEQQSRPPPANPNAQKLPGA